VTVPEHVQEAAEWYAANQATFWQSRRLLLEWVGDHGPVRLEDGRSVAFLVDGNSWDSEGVAEVMPALIKQAAVTFEGPQERIERILDLVVEEFGAEQPFTVKRSVDAALANGVIRQGGEAAARLLPHRITRTKMGIR
jgi:hypothetical protein